MAMRKSAKSKRSSKKTRRHRSSRSHKLRGGACGEGQMNCPVCKGTKTVLQNKKPVQCYWCFGSGCVKAPVRVYECEGGDC
jgi:hypothetical protein